MKTLVETLKNKLRNGIVTFQYIKKNGELRTAKGTTNSEFLESVAAFKGGHGPKDFGYTPYWDVERNEWRCFDENRVVSVGEGE